MECPQVGRGGVFRQITSNWFQTCSLRIALCIICMIKVKKCFGKGFGLTCALKRWSVQERAQTSFCPVARQILQYLAVPWQQVLCSALTLSYAVALGTEQGNEASTQSVLHPNCWCSLLLHSLPAWWGLQTRSYKEWVACQKQLPDCAQRRYQCL